MDNVVNILKFGYVGHLILALCLGALASHMILGSHKVNVEGWKCTNVPVIGLVRCTTPTQYQHLSPKEQAVLFVEVAYRNEFF